MHTQILLTTIIGQVFVSLSLVFLLATIITFVVNKYVNISIKILFCCFQILLSGVIVLTIFFFIDSCHRSLWNMRNYIHVMLCANLFATQLVFVVGVERTENKVLKRKMYVL